METKLESALKEQGEKQELRKLSEARETKVKLNQRALMANNRRTLRSIQAFSDHHPANTARSGGPQDEDWKRRKS